MKTITVSFPLGLFGNATMNIPEAAATKEPVTILATDRELLDMPNIIPETESANGFFYFNDVAG